MILTSGAKICCLVFLLVITNKAEALQQEERQSSCDLNSGWKEGRLGGFIWQDDCDFKGFATATATVKDLAVVDSDKYDCGIKCQEQSECTHFTWIGKCILKKTTDSERFQYLKGAICGKLRDRTTVWFNGFNNLSYIWREDCDFRNGNIYDLVTVDSSKENCGFNCLMLNGCTHFSWGWNGKCVLKKASYSENFTYQKDVTCGKMTAIPNFGWREDQAGFIWMENCNFGAGNVRELAVVDSAKEECSRKCRQRSDCTHFTWNGKCILKNAPSTESFSILKDATCGKLKKFTRFGWVEGEGGGFFWKENCGFCGENVQDLDIIDSENYDCGIKCQERSGCTHFTWNGNGKCILKKAPSTESLLYINNTVCGKLKTITLLGFYEGNGGGFVWKENCGFWGQNVQDLEVVDSDKNDCGIKCKKRSGCTHFTWNGNGKCILKKAPSTESSYFLTNNSCGTLATIALLGWNEGRGGGFIWGENCDFSSGNVQDLAVVDSEKYDCGMKCQERSGCTHFTWNGQGKCILKRAPSTENFVFLNNNSCGKLKTITLLGWNEGKGGGFIWGENCGFWGEKVQDLDVVDSTSEECGIKCQERFGCTHFTWNGQGKCILKKASSTESFFYLYSNTCGKLKKIHYWVRWKEDQSTASVWEENCDFRGRNVNDLAVVNSTKEECSLKCRQWIGCTHFTWKGKCFLKKAPASESFSILEDAICGKLKIMRSGWIEGEGGGYILKENCDFSSGNVQDLEVVDSEKYECGIKCQERSGCTHFTWNGQGKCILKRAPSTENFIFLNNNSCGKLKTITLLGWNEGKGGGFIWGENCGFWGEKVQDLDVVNSTTEDCGIKCQERNECTHFTWNGQGKCILKKAPSTESFFYLQNHICGKLKRDLLLGWKEDQNTGFIWEENCEFMGGNVKDLAVVNSTKAECSLKCKQQSDCTHFTWNENCNLKNAPATENFVIKENSICGRFKKM